MGSHAGGRIRLLKGDITCLDADAVVNAANSGLAGGGGVDGAIHAAGGPVIMQECRDIIRQIGALETGKAVITSAGDMKASFVIHTVGPVWKGGGHGEADALAECYRSSLFLAVSRGLKTIAFPNISTGVYGYPKREAAEIALKTVLSELERFPAVMEVIFVCHDEENYDLYRNFSG